MGANGLNQLTSAGAVSLGYDGQGNLNLSGAQNYTYTSENRLASAYNWSGTGSNGYAQYDPLGRLLQVSDYNISKSTLIDHVGTSLIAEYEFTAAGLTLQRRYVCGPGTDEPLFGEGVIVLQGLALLTLPLAGLTLFLRRRARRKAIK